MILSLYLLNGMQLAVAAPNDEVNNIACLPGEQLTVPVSDDNTEVLFAVRGEAGLLESPSRSCWCGERQQVSQNINRFNTLLAEMQSSKKIPTDATQLKTAYENGNDTLQQAIILQLGLVQDFEFSLSLSPGTGRRSQMAACLGETEMGRYVTAVRAYLNSIVTK